MLLQESNIEEIEIEFLFDHLEGFDTPINLIHFINNNDNFLNA